MLPFFGVQQSESSVQRAAQVCSVSCAQSSSQVSKVPSRPWLFLGLAPGWAGLWPSAGWPRAGLKEELCCVPELLSVEVHVTQGASSLSLSPTCAVAWREGKKRHAIVMASGKAERERRQTRAYEKQTGQDQRQFFQRAKLLTV